MKNWKHWIIVAIIALFGMMVGFTACDPEGNTGGSGNSGGNDIGGVTYTVTYNAMGATGTPPEKVTVTDGSTISLHNGNGFSRTGYILDGWYTTIAGTTSYYDAGSQYIVTDNVTFYAKWVSAYTVAFNINGGSGTTPESLIVGTGSEIILPSGGFSRDDFTFGGWTATLSGGTKYDAGSSFTVTRNITMNAIWYLPGVFVNNRSASIKNTLTLSHNGTYTHGTIYYGTSIDNTSGAYYIEDNSVRVAGFGSGWNIVDSNTLFLAYTGGVGGEYYYRQQ